MSNSESVLGLSQKDRDTASSFIQNSLTGAAFGVAVAYSVFGILPSATAAIVRPNSSTLASAHNSNSSSTQEPWNLGRMSISRSTETPNPAQFADRLLQFKEQTALTWDQIARLFGVSRRAVHHWAVGGKMNSVNVEMLSHLESYLVSDIPTQNPEDRNREIFALMADGKSRFEKVLSKYSSKGLSISGSAMNAAEQIVSLQN
jgi:hypothetical protein